MKKTRLLAATFLVMLFTMLNAACAFANTTINGHLDSIEGNAVAGWLWDSSNPEVSQTITVTVTDNATGNIVAEETKEANEYRSDLESADIGTGNYGFHVGIEWDTLPESSYTVSLSCGEITLNQTLSHVTGTTLIHDNLIPLGTFKTTAYCPCYQCSEGWGRQTSSGALATANHTVAVDKRVIPMGTRLLINGKEYVAQDVGGGVKGNHIDIYFNTHGETREHGVRNAEVFIIQS
ncbi:MAG: 3D domain-containing protein [Lachnospiraceae bacterium]|nr:3D domain-containing protein [Lachnospiraceae bacterium]